MSEQLAYNEMLRLAHVEPLSEAIHALERELEKRESVFRAFVGRTFDSDVHGLSGAMALFVRAETVTQPINALYLELNDFVLNPNPWYCDLFGYRIEGALSDPEWLSSWDTETAAMELKAMVDLQSLFPDPLSDAPPLKQEEQTASTLAAFLIIARFQEAVGKAQTLLAYGAAIANVPSIIAGAHDYDIFRRFR